MLFVGSWLILCVFSHHSCGIVVRKYLGSPKVCVAIGQNCVWVEIIAIPMFGGMVLAAVGFIITASEAGLLGLKPC